MRILCESKINEAKPLKTKISQLTLLWSYRNFGCNKDFATALLLFEP